VACSSPARPIARKVQAPCWADTAPATHQGMAGMKVACPLASLVADAGSPRTSFVLLPPLSRSLRKVPLYGKDLHRSPLQHNKNPLFVLHLEGNPSSQKGVLALALCSSYFLP
jgi:hypothetical protein